MVRLQVGSEWASPPAAASSSSSSAAKRTRAVRDCRWSRPMSRHQRWGPAQRRPPLPQQPQQPLQGRPAAAAACGARLLEGWGAVGAVGTGRCGSPAACTLCLASSCPVQPFQSAGRTQVALLVSLHRGEVRRFWLVCGQQQRRAAAAAVECCGRRAAPAQHWRLRHCAPILRGFSSFLMRSFSSRFSSSLPRGRAVGRFRAAASSGGERRWQGPATACDRLAGSAQGTPAHARGRTT